MELDFFGNFSYYATVVNILDRQEYIEVYLIYKNTRLKRNLKCVKREVAKGDSEYKLLGNLCLGDKVLACPEEEHVITGVVHENFFKRMINLAKARR